MILILKWVPLWDNLHKKYARERLSTRWQEFRKKIFMAPIGIHQENKGSRFNSRPQFRSENNPVTIKQAKFCWVFNDWRSSATLLVFKIFPVEFSNYSNYSQRECPPLTGYLKGLNRLKSSSKQASRFLNSWLKTTRLNFFTPSWSVMRWRRSKTSTAHSERVWE